ncbi:MAG: RNA helicase [Proteobacteria bacterium]|nr:MAG: RNA helicase [Pseudomonadota bacterium]PIE40473.1 MAG: RNA helicase [Gammaproteobacteria bacterium]
MEQTSLALEELALDERLLKALAEQGFDTATEVQARVIPQALAGKDLLVSAKTGSGKTAAFVLSMLQCFLNQPRSVQFIRALIVAPTRELASQIKRAFDQMAAFTEFHCALVIGGEDFKRQLTAVRRIPQVLIATPGRLLEYIEDDYVDFSQLDVLVVDEADRMLDMGFVDAMQTIAGECNPDRQTWLFSATLKNRDVSRIADLLRDPARIRVDTRFHGHSQLRQQRVLADDDKHKVALIAALVEEEAANRVFVFCNTRAQVQQVCSKLNYKKLRAAYIHGEVSQSSRKKVMEKFRQGVFQVLVATDLAARGLDINDVDMVINHTVAPSGDDHVHRAGRTGRAGQSGTVVTLVNSMEWNLMSSIERYLKIRFEPRKVKGLEAHYTGPKNLKKSGKMARKGKRKTKAKTKTKTKTKTNEVITIG